MPTRQAAVDTVNIATILLSQYHEGTALYELLGSSDQEGLIPDSLEFTVDLSGEDNQLSSLIASLNAVQLAFNAAAVAVIYDRDWIRDDQYIDSGVLRNLAYEDFISFEIVELANGSFRAKLKAVFTNPLTWIALTGIVGLGAVALTTMFALPVVPAILINAPAMLVLPIIGQIISSRKSDQEDIEGADNRAKVGAEIEQIRPQVGGLEVADNAAAHRGRISIQINIEW